MPKSQTNAELDTMETTGLDVAKALAVKVAATAVTIIGVGIVTHVLEKKYGKTEE